jgi:hypothetical protein
VGWFVSDEREAVEGLTCLCTGQVHPDGDTVWLRKELEPEGGYAVLRAIREAQADPEELPQFLGRAYAKHGIVDWTFVDEDGPVPCTAENIARLSWAAVYPIAERGDGLYAETLLAPLRDRLSKPSRNGHIARSTSRKRATTSTRPKP